MAQIRLDKVSFRYAEKIVPRGISLNVGQGQIVFLLGPNGSGKTTLIKVLLGLKQAETGEVYLKGEPVSAMTPRRLARTIAYVPQSHRATSAYTVLDVVLLGRTVHKSLFTRYTRIDRELALHALERLSIVHLRDKSFTEISGGERQLTLIARALSQGVDTLVMDEPATGLDFANQVRFFAHIARLANDGLTCIPLWALDTDYDVGAPSSSDARRARRISQYAPRPSPAAGGNGKVGPAQKGGRQWVIR